ncbi:MAG: DM13 domain-containing protein [Saprospiraceae bacterium]|nr:DM13 domain-containing protein [Saprospiraceae bacterium]
MKHLLFAIWGIMLFSSCIGTDLIEETEVPEQVIISTNISSIKVGEEIQLKAFYTNTYGITEDKQVTWSTTMTDIINVSASGLAKGVKLGDATIEARVGNVVGTRSIKVSQDSNPNISSSTRKGTFKAAGSGSYKVSGDVVITTIDGKSQIVVSENFKASTGPSLFLLLTNHTNGSYMVMSNNPVINGTSAQITPTRMTKFSGAMTWDVPAGVDVKNYKYALLYCTLGPVFGFAELK